MASNYPGALPDTPLTHQDVQDDIAAIAAELGTNPSGAAATVADAIAGKASPADITSAVAAIDFPVDSVNGRTGAVTGLAEASALTGLATSSSVTSAVSTHAAVTTSVHGITDTAALVTSTTVDDIVSLSQAAYDALGTPNAATLYVIV